MDLSLVAPFCVTKTMLEFFGQSLVDDVLDLFVLDYISASSGPVRSKISRIFG